MVAAAVVAGAGTLAGCGNSDGVVEKSFTDRSGRVCTYVLVQDVDDDGGAPDLDARNIDCDYPPSPSASGGERP
jgi:hypothetical protein